MTLLFFLLIFCLPFAIQGFFGLYSLTSPFLFCTAFFCAVVVAQDLFKKNSGVSTFSIPNIDIYSMLPLFLHNIFVYLIGVNNPAKMFTSSLLFVVFLILKNIISNWLRNINPFSFDRQLSFMYWTFCLFGLLGVLDISLLQFKFAKAIFVFAEPSHYFYIFSVFWSYMIFSNKQYSKKKSVLARCLFYSMIPLIIGLQYESASCVLIFLSLIFLSFLKDFGLSKRIQLSSFTTLIATSLFVPIVIAVIMSNSYYSSRLSLTAADSVANLAYLSGMERGLNTLKDFSNYGIGFGFQQMSADLVQNFGPITIQLESMSLLVNSHDGSFMFSKLLVEFGYLGLIASLWFVILAFKRFRFYFFIGADNSPFISIILASCFSLFFYIFIRGGGYFSPIFLLFWLQFDIYKNMTGQIRSYTL